MQFRNLLLAGTVAVAAAALASAQTQPLNVKLGLWEVTSTNQMSGMPAMPNVDLSKVPPEQRERIEAMMKAREGMTNGKPTVTKQCLTKEKLEKQLFEDRQDSSCKRTVVTSTSSVMELKLECIGNQKMNGTVRFEALTPEAVKGTVHFIADAQGRPMTVDSNIAAKWVSGDCGDVK